MLSKLLYSSLLGVLFVWTVTGSAVIPASDEQASTIDHIVESTMAGTLLAWFLAFIGLVGLFAHEQRFASRAKALIEALANAKDIQAITSSATYEPEFDGKLIRVAGFAQPVGLSQVSDADFGVTLNVLKLCRKVEIYQWIEEKQTSSQRVPVVSSAHCPGADIRSF